MQLLNIKDQNSENEAQKLFDINKSGLGQLKVLLEERKQLKLEKQKII